MTKTALAEMPTNHIGFWSISNKITAAIGATVLMLFGVIIAIQAISEAKRTQTFLHVSNLETSELLAAQVGGGIRFKKSEAIESAYANLVSTPESSVASILTFTEAGEPVSTYHSGNLPNFEPGDMPPVLAEAIRDETLQQVMIGGQQIVAIPALYGKKKL